MTLTAPKTSSISIITPVLNEEQVIASFLDALTTFSDVEHILVDGGSTDRTIQIIRRYPVKLLEAPPGRGPQQNTGAAAAGNEILLFLHCDTRLPENFPSIVTETLENPLVAAGAFRLGIDHPAWPYRLVERGANLRSRLLHLPYGDQALFMKKKTFNQAGGFPEQPILEEITLLRRLRPLGNIHIARPQVTTSARRWQRLGVLQTTALNQLVLAGLILGISPRRLARFYLRRR